MNAHTNRPTERGDESGGPNDGPLGGWLDDSAPRPQHRVTAGMGD